MNASTGFSVMIQMTFFRIYCRNKVTLKRLIHIRQLTTSEARIKQITYRYSLFLPPYLSHLSVFESVSIKSLSCCLLSLTDSEVTTEVMSALQFRKIFSQRNSTKEITYTPQSLAAKKRKKLSSIRATSKHLS